jgi:predicted enzyme related to lactoylglutathione lyase
MSSVAIDGIDVHTYLVKDPARALAFWRDTMGLKCTWSMERGAEFELPDGSSFGIWLLDDGDWVQGTGIMFAVSDFEAAVEYYRSRGVSIDSTEENPTCFMAFAEDSEGNHFILHKRKGD